MTENEVAEAVQYERPWLYAKQLEALFHDERYGLVEASTKSGKTVGCLAWLLEQALDGRPRRNYWWVAPVYPQAAIAFRRMRDGLPHQLYRENKTDLSLTLANQAVLWFKSGEKSDNLYGEDVYAAVIDEASRLREDSWHAVRSTLTATRGPIRIIGNVKGRRNWFYKMARRAEDGEADMRYSRLTWRDAVEGGVLDQAEVEDAQRVLPARVFDELYAAEASDDEGNPFGIDAIEACTVAELSAGPPIAWGWDLAKSIDWTVGIAIDAGGGVCRLERWQNVPWSATEERIAQMVGDTRALVDSTGVGDPILERLQQQCSKVEGFKFTSPAKQQIMEGLSLVIQGREISIPSGPITTELLGFEFAYTRTGVRYQAMDGLHDDCVDALALAVRCWKQPRRTHMDLIAELAAG